jgi:hypothetical protein
MGSCPGQEVRVFTKQVSVFLENKKGRLAEVTKLLTDEGINIRALSLADMADFGVLRLIVNDRARCLEVLKAHEFAAQETDVIAVEIEDRPGSLHRILEILDGKDINVEYIYAFLEKSGKNAIGVFKIDDGPRAVEVLRENGIPVLPGDVVQNL